MENELSITEKRFVRSLLAVKTDAELAEMLEKPVGLITQEISLMTGIIKRPASAKSKEAPAPRKYRKKTADTKAHKAVKQQKPPSTSSLEMQRAIEKKKKLQSETFPTRKLDLTDSIPVRLNHKTVVYVKPGTDIEKLKKQFNIS